MASLGTLTFCKSLSISFRVILSSWHIHTLTQVRNFPGKDSVNVMCIHKNIPSNLQYFVVRAHWNRVVLSKLRVKIYFPMSKQCPKSKTRCISGNPIHNCWYVNVGSTLSTITQTGANDSLGMSYFSSTACNTCSKTGRNCLRVEETDLLGLKFV